MALKKLRLKIAKKKRVPAYMIFSDRSLLDMSHRKPSNQLEFAKVFGVGEAKLKEFSQLFMDLIAERQNKIKDI